MAINLVLSQAMGDVNLVTIEDPENRWQRIVIVTKIEDHLNITNLNGDPNKILLELTPNVQQRS